MITLQYQDKAENYKVTHTITFKTEEAYEAFVAAPGVYEVSVERSGKAAASRLNSLFGGGQ